MSRVCSICGKGQTAGNNVSHSNRTDYVCTRCLKSDKVERV